MYLWLERVSWCAEMVCLLSFANSHAQLGIWKIARPQTVTWNTVAQGSGFCFLDVCLMWITEKAVSVLVGSGLFLSLALKTKSSEDTL